MEYLVIGVIALLVIVGLLLIIKVEKLRNKANALFLEAEKYVTEDKLNYVSTNLYENAPSIFRLVFDEEDFQYLVQILYNNTRSIARDLLDNRKIR